MARFGFVGPSYQSQSVNADAQMCMNFYPEVIESGQGASGMALYSTPGLKLFFNAPDPGPVRGDYTINGRTFHVSANNVYEVGALGTALHTYAASITNDALPVSFAGGSNQLLIASGGNAYVIDLTLNTLTLIPAGTLTNVSMVAYIDGFFFALIKNSNQIFASTLLDATSWPPLATTKVSVFTDNVISIFADHRELAVAGPRASQVYFDSGNSPFPLDIIPGAFIEQGIAAQFSIVKIDNSVFWLGADERGQGIVWRMQGYNPIRISNHAIELAIQSYARMDDAVAFSYQDQGHSFYWLSFPTAQKTWVYDVATNMWHERGFWNTVAGVFNQHLAQYHTFNFGKHLVGGPFSGKLYDMSIAYLDDIENPIRRVRRAPHISNEKEWMFHSQLQVDFETGVTPQPLFPDAPLVAVADNFNRANENPILAPWVLQGGAAFFQGQISGNQYIGQNALQTANLYDGGITWPPDQFSQATLQALPVNSGLAGLVVRGNTANQDCYVFTVEAFAGEGIGLPCIARIHRLLGVTTTFLATTTITPQIGDIFKIQVIGTIITCFQNGVPILTATDSFVTSGNPGLLTLSIGAATIAWDDWSSNSIPTFRGPQAMLRWSDDGGHAWSNIYNVDCGTAGNYLTRAIWRRLGRSRDRIYELSVSDPVPWRVVDAYLQASPGFQPTERMIHQIRKSA